jgi:hypothetical protein
VSLLSSRLRKWQKFLWSAGITSHHALEARCFAAPKHRVDRSFQAQNRRAGGLLYD